MTTTRQAVDWRAERDRIDDIAVATSLLGPPPGRRGDNGRRLWWHCPFPPHDDRNPSFAVERGKGWRCYGCGLKGSVYDLVMRLTGKSFRETREFLNGGSLPSVKLLLRPTPAKPREERPPEPTGLPEREALALVLKAQERLWTPEGADAMNHLTNDRRLSLETIRSARLGVVAGASIPTVDYGRYFQASGVVIPWFDDSGRLAVAKIRQPEGRRPKYAEAFRDPSRVVCYPRAGVIRPGLPVILTEGELDCLVLAQALGDVASVVTLGSSSARPNNRLKSAMLPAWPVFIATDADEAGDKAAEAWLSPSRRIRPPVGKDWTDAAAYGVDLKRWWKDVFDGNNTPALFNWPELCAMRWGPAIGDPTPGIIID